MYNGKVGKGRQFSRGFSEFYQNFNQVIYTMDTTCEPNTMILAHVALEIFCSQASIDIQWESWKIEIIQSWN